MNSRGLTRVGYVVLAAALIFRLVSVHFYPLSWRIFSDMGNYVNIANDLREGVWKPTHFFQPIGFSYIVYLFLLTFDDWTRALGIYQSIIGTASLWLMWKAAEHSFGQRVGVISLLVGAVHAPLLGLNLYALSETTFTFLLSLLLWMSVKVLERDSYGWSALWGLTFFAAFVIKGTHIFMAPLFLLGVLVWKRWSWQAISRVAVPVSAVVAMGLLLHGVLTYKTIGTFQLSASAGGLNLVEGKCPLKENVDSEGATWFSPVYVQLGYTGTMVWERPFTDSGYFMREGLRCIKDDPLVLVQSLENVPLLFVGNVLWPVGTTSAGPYFRLHGILWGCFVIVGLVVWCRSYWPWRPDDWPVVLTWAVPILALFLCVYVFKSEIRFRVPFDVFFIPVALKGWASILNLSMTNAAAGGAEASA